MNVKKRLYRGGHPNWLANALNRCWAAIHALGVAPNRLVTLEVRGRRSGRTIRLPLVMALFEGNATGHTPSIIVRSNSWKETRLDMRACCSSALPRDRHTRRHPISRLQLHCSSRQRTVCHWRSHEPSRRSASYGAIVCFCLRSHWASGCRRAETAPYA